jgi:hypothetical protein
MIELTDPWPLMKRKVLDLTEKDMRRGKGVNSTLRAEGEVKAGDRKTAGV